MLGASKSAKFFRMALWAVALAFVSVTFNAYARLSEAGLGCPDWPGCYGKLFAPLTAQDIENGRSLEDPRKLEKKRAMQDTATRFLAVSLSFVLIRLFVLGWELKKRKRTQQVLIPLATLVATFALAGAGFANFEHRFTPLIQMMQLLGGMTILGLLWWIVMREQRVFRSATPTPLTRALRPRTLFALALVSVQIALGGWAMVNHTGLACPDFPTCQGSYWPPMDFLEAFTLWQYLGLDYQGRLLNLPAATAVHYAHRVGALIVLLYVGWLSLHLLRVGFQDKLCRYGLLLLTVLLSQTALGVVEVLAHLPLAMAVAHSAGAALMLMATVTVYHVMRAPPRAG